MKELNLRENTACAEILNNFFSHSVKNLDINRDLYTNNDTNLDDPIENIIERFKTHPSVVRIWEKGYKTNNFSFHIVPQSDVYRVIKNIGSKAYQKDNIPPKVLSDNADVLSSFIHDDINQNINKGKFPDNLKKRRYHTHF